VSLFDAIWVSGRETAVLIPNALQILCQLFLRHYPLWQAGDPLWQESGMLKRLPLAQFMDDLNQHALENQSVRDWLESVYPSYCLGQHEIIALQKLRYNKYNTFKFYYQDDEFAWANNPARYEIPLRFQGLRLFNGLTSPPDKALMQLQQFSHYFRSCRPGGNIGIIYASIMIIGAYTSWLYSVTLKAEPANCKP